MYYLLIQDSWEATQNCLWDPSEYLLSIRGHMESLESLYIYTEPWESLYSLQGTLEVRFCPEGPLGLSLFSIVNVSILYKDH